MESIHSKGRNCVVSKNIMNILNTVVANSSSPSFSVLLKLLEKLIIEMAAN